MSRSAQRWPGAPPHRTGRCAGPCGCRAASGLSVRRYGFHRDELYFIESMHHPAWGYIDNPSLTPAVGWLSSACSATLCSACGCYRLSRSAWSSSSSPPSLEAGRLARGAARRRRRDRDIGLRVGDRPPVDDTHSRPPGVLRHLPAARAHRADRRATLVDRGWPPRRCGSGEQVHPGAVPTLAGGGRRCHQDVETTSSAAGPQSASAWRSSCGFHSWRGRRRTAGPRSSSLAPFARDQMAENQASLIPFQRDPAPPMAAFFLAAVWALTATLAGLRSASSPQATQCSSSCSSSPGARGTTRRACSACSGTAVGIDRHLGLDRARQGPRPNRLARSRHRRQPAPGACITLPVLPPSMVNGPIGTLNPTRSRRSGGRRSSTRSPRSHCHNPRRSDTRW